MNLAGYRPTPALSGISNLNTRIRNRFDGYKDPYGFEDQSTFLDKIFGEYENQINQGASELTANQQQGAASRMASRGITGGSAVDDTMSSIGTNIGKSKFNALSNLKVGKSQGLLGLMDAINKRKLQKETLGSSVDQQNVGNEMQQALAIANAYLGNRGMDIQEKSSPGTLDDIFSGLGDMGSLFAGIVEMFPELFASGDAIAVPLAAASDIRLKENISKVGTQNGFNIYDFNYIGNPRRFRGVIADEVEQTRPDAVTTINGIKHVFYDKIGIQFREV